MVLGKKSIIPQLLGLCFLLAGLNGWAAELRGPEVGAIPFGMGRAYSALADDWLALHYNPAGLASVKGLEFQVFDLRIEGNEGAVSSYDNVDALTDSSTTTVQKLNLLMGKHLVAKAGNVSQITIPGFALGVSYDMKLDFDLQNLSLPRTDVTYTKDLAVHFGTGWGFGAKKNFRIGIASRYMRRTGGTQTIGIDEIASSTNTSLLSRFGNSGDAFAVDAGMQYTIPTKGRAEFTTSWAWHDIGRTTFGKFSDSNRPTAIENNMVVGLGLRLPIGGTINRRSARRFGQPRSNYHLSFAFDYSHLLQPPEEVHLPKHLHFGMNLSLPIFNVQLGLNQTSLTFGAGTDIGAIRVQASSYAEELGSYAGQRRDRRYVLTIGSSFGISKL